MPGHYGKSTKKAMSGKKDMPMGKGGHHQSAQSAKYHMPKKAMFGMSGKK